MTVASAPNSTSPAQDDRRWPAVLRWTLITLVAAGFTFPFAAACWLNASPLTIANESIAYRFLFSERLLNGEGASVWVLAGFLTTAIQTTILAAINLFIPSTPADLPLRLDVYAYLFSGLVTAAGVAIIVAVGRAREFPVTRLLILALAAIGPLYFTRDTGFYYFTLPDYYHLNVLLSFGIVAAFQAVWLNARASNTGAPASLPLLLGCSVLVGAAAANKITLLPLGGVLLVGVLFRAPISPGRLVWQSLAGFAAVAFGFVFTVWWFYLFKLQAVIDMFSAWSSYVSDPGGESDFWQKFQQYLVNSNYGFTFGIFLVSVALGATFGLRERSRRLSAILVGIVILAAGVVWGYFVYKRPAGTTFFEAVSAILALAACGLTLTVHRRAGRIAAIVIIAASSVYGFATFKWQKNTATLRESGPWAANMWTLHQNLVEFAAGRPIAVVHPQNHYGYGGVAEFLLKGTADVPTWHVTEHGQPVLDKYLPHATYRHEYGGTSPNVAYPPGSVIFWVDRPEFEPMTQLFPGLAAAVAQPGAETREWPRQISGGRVTIIGRAVALPDSLPPDQAAALATPFQNLTFSRLSYEHIDFKWDPDPICQVEIEFSGVGGAAMPLGLGEPGLDSYLLRNLTKGQDYEIRIRKSLHGRTGPWTQILVPADSAPDYP